MGFGDVLALGGVGVSLSLSLSLSLVVVGLISVGVVEFVIDVVVVVVEGYRGGGDW